MGDLIKNMSPPSMGEINSESASISAKVIVISMIVLFFVLAFCFFLSLYAKWYWSRNEDPSIVSWRRQAFRNRTTAQAGARRRGLDRAALQSIPVLMYDPKDFIKEGLECSVCISEITKGENIRLLPKCNHGFHVECIDMWLKSHSTCPLCRNSINSSQNQSVIMSGTDSNNRELGNVSDSNSDSDSDLNSDHEHSSRSRVSNVNSGDAPSIPTNVLFFGNEVRVRSLRENTSNTVTPTSTSTASSSNQREELVIEIPRDLCNDCSSTPSSRAEFIEEAKTPTVSRLRSLKRLLSRGKMVPSWVNGSSSTDIESV
ncbi:hypothetical protein RND81_01G071000 [Saponaria officinalis]|uniref:RING-type E3 ubiquitin transferase n=1 Tax=Saponaria officinalis TaxID=3572 RepID=A0AAW1N914_SAPOF